MNERTEKMSKRQILAAITCTSALTTAAMQHSLAQSIDKPMYMGTASTGEKVWYFGGRAQCGDLPKSDECWRNPMIMYKLGNEEFNTVLDCRRKIFKEAWSVTYQKVYRDIKPSSPATKKMVAIACSNSM